MDDVSAMTTAQMPDLPLSGEFHPHLPGVRYGILDDLLGYAVRRAQIAMHNRFVQAMQGCDITPQRFAALVLIDCNEGLKLTHLAQILGIARSGVVVLIDALSEMGYVDRRPVDGDRRAYGLSLTAHGRKSLRNFERIVAQQDALGANQLSPHQLKQLKAYLDTVSQSHA